MSRIGLPVLKCARGAGLRGEVLVVAQETFSG